jgi:hypothetical protein
MIGGGIAQAGTAASIAAVEDQPLTNVVVDTISGCDAQRPNIKID